MRSSAAEGMGGGAEQRLDAGLGTHAPSTPAARFYSEINIASGMDIPSAICTTKLALTPSTLILFDATKILVKISSDITHAAGF